MQKDTKKGRKRKFDDVDGGQTYLDEQSLNYYKRVLSMLEEGFPDEEEKAIFLTNVFKTLLKELVPASRHCRTSWTVQKLLAQASRNQYLQIFTCFSHHWSRVCSDRFASHVIQELVALVPNFLPLEENTSFEAASESEKNELFEISTVGADLSKHGDSVTLSYDEPVAVMSLNECFDSLCAYLKESLKKFVSDVYASHILRVFLHVLGGVPGESNLERSQFSRKEQKGVGKEIEVTVTSHKVVPAWVTTLSEITEEMLSMKNLSDLIFNRVSNPVLQTLLLVLSKSRHRLATKCWNVLVVTADLDNVDSESGLPAALTDSVTSHLLQQCLRLADNDQCNFIYSNYLKGKSLVMALHHTANYVLQTLIEVAPVQLFQEIYKELKSNVEDILANSRTGVITALLKRSVSLKVKQKKLIKVMLKAFHCSEEDRQVKCVPVIASLTTYEMYFQLASSDQSARPPPMLSSDSINLHGSLIVQSLLQMKACDSVITSFLDLQSKEICNMSVCSKGCHIVEAFLKSPAVTEEGVGSFLDKVKKHVAELSCHKYGSRIMDAVWSRASLQQKELLAKELVKHSTRLQNDFQGKFIFRNFALADFQNKLSVWREKQCTTNKDIVPNIAKNEGGGTKKKKHKRK